VTRDSPCPRPGRENLNLHFQDILGDDISSLADRRESGPNFTFFASARSPERVLGSTLRSPSRHKPGIDHSNGTPGGIQTSSTVLQFFVSGNTGNPFTNANIANVVVNVLRTPARLSPTSPRRR